MIHVKENYVAFTRGAYTISHTKSMVWLPYKECECTTKRYRQLTITQQHLDLVSAKYYLLHLRTKTFSYTSNIWKLALCRTTSHSTFMRYFISMHSGASNTISKGVSEPTSDRQKIGFIGFAVRSTSHVWFLFQFTPYSYRKITSVVFSFG